jgi:ribA/ribD-fused uncharacterized protein
MAIEFWAARKRNEDGTMGGYDENFYLSNFYRAPITTVYNGETITFRTSENYYQAMKFRKDPEKFTQILNAKTPREAADLGRTFTDMDPDWDKNKVEIMESIVFEKFKQNLDIREKLLATGDEHLIEASPRDSFWGFGPDKKGKNMLGIVLMNVRKKLRETLT